MNVNFLKNANAVWNRKYLVYKAKELLLELKNDRGLYYEPDGSARDSRVLTTVIRCYIL